MSLCIQGKTDAAGNHPGRVALSGMAETPGITDRTLRNQRAATREFRRAGLTGQLARRCGYRAALLMDHWSPSEAKAEALRVFPREEGENHAR